MICWHHKRRNRNICCGMRLKPNDKDKLQLQRHRRCLWKRWQVRLARSRCSSCKRRTSWLFPSIKGLVTEPLHLLVRWSFCSSNRMINASLSKTFNADVQLQHSSYWYRVGGFFHFLAAFLPLKITSSLTRGVGCW
jgi:hypothetical protein